MCESFCLELWAACAPPPPFFSLGSPDDDAPHMGFCTQQLGVRVGGAVLTSGRGDGLAHHAGAALGEPPRAHRPVDLPHVVVQQDVRGAR